MGDTVTRHEANPGPARPRWAPGRGGDRAAPTVSAPRATWSPVGAPLPGGDVEEGPSARVGGGDPAVGPRGHDSTGGSTQRPFSPLPKQRRLQRDDVRWFLLWENLRSGGDAVTPGQEGRGPGQGGGSGMPREGAARVLTRASEHSPPGAARPQPLLAGPEAPEERKRGADADEAGAPGLTSAPVPPGAPSACPRCRGRTPRPG